MTVTVFVSGATGFIAQHIVVQLLKKNYKVIGSVRSAEKGDSLKKELNNDNFSYEIVEDVAIADGFDDALKKHPEVTVFLHTAAPYHYNATDNVKELITPAVEGTKNALNSIKKHAPQITHVVVTSSVGAISRISEAEDTDEVYTENSWNPTTPEEALIDARYGYRAAKTFAEKAAWDFVKTEKPNFVLNSINPTFVFGPQAFKSSIKETLNTSAEIVNAVLKAGTDESKLVQRAAGYIDVRDVARAHIYAFESDVKNFRFYLYAGRFTTQTILDIINAKIPQLKGKVCVGTPGAGQDLIDKCAKVDNSQTRKYLGEFIPFEQVIIDTVSQIIS